MRKTVWRTGLIGEAPATHPTSSGCECATNLRNGVPNLLSLPATISHSAWRPHREVTWTWQCACSSVPPRSAFPETQSAAKTGPWRRRVWWISPGARGVWRECWSGEGPGGLQAIAPWGPISLGRSRSFFPENAEKPLILGTEWNGTGLHLLHLLPTEPGTRLWAPKLESEPGGRG